MAFAVQVQEGRGPQTARRTVPLGLAPPCIHCGAWQAGREREESRAVRRGRGHRSRRRGGAVRATLGWVRPSLSRLAAPEPVVPRALHAAAHACKLLCGELQSGSLCPGARGKEVSVGTGAQAGLPTSGCPGRRPRPRPEPRPRAAGCRSHHLQALFVTCETGGHLVLRVPGHAAPYGPLHLLPCCCSALDIHGLGP